ncbi:MAG TPA: DUF87 domain-containing protein [Candidatus Paceibacterota bacterium]|nr:DUF87 domain-containing protein [Candidatus Paceibacterota bacterium]
MPEPLPKFKSPEEELAYLRGELARREAAIGERMPLSEVKKEEIGKAIIKEYAEKKPAAVLPPERIMPAKEAEGITLKLKPETHDSQMAELLGLLLEKGIRNVLTLLERSGNSHLEDDFHRFLVQYIIAAGEPPGLTPDSRYWASTHLALFEVTLPGLGVSEREPKSFKEFIAKMEQFYSGLSDVPYYTLEIAVSAGSDEVVVYAAVPRNKADLFEKQVLGFYPDARINSAPNDYNIFNMEGSHVGGYFKLAEDDALSLKNYEEFGEDPISAVLNVFAKLKREGEGAALQLVIRPGDASLIKRYKAILAELQKGKSFKKALDVWGSFGKEFGIATKKLFFGHPEKKEEEKKIDEKSIEKVNFKMKSPLAAAAIRLVASAETAARAEEIISDLTSAFHQFSEAGGNSLIFESVLGKDNPEFIRQFTYRLPEAGKFLNLNLKELASIFHFPAGVTSMPQLKEATAKSAPAPMELPKEGILLGANSYRGRDTNIFYAKEDRMRHFYVLGQTGTGKTTILKNMVIQDIKNGDGVCFIDPHGSDVQDILGHIPKERIDDVIYFDPSYTARPMALNMLEFDPKFPEHKSLVVNDLMAIFSKLFDLKTSGGPMFEQYFRNSALLVMEHSESGNTLLEIGRVMGDKDFRDYKLANCKNPIITEFWKNAERTTGEQSLANFVGYITSKFDVFISNEIMRPVVLQEKSSFNFREIMDNKKILLVNLAKGRLGELNANLIGLVLVGRILMAALSRVDMFGKEMNDFYLYIDEFQNVTTDATAQILSEARKYRLSLNIAHQFIGQLPDNIKTAVFGNVGSMAIFRVGADDAKYLESQFAPIFMADDITKLPNFNAYLKLLIGGQPQKPFNIRLMPPIKGQSEIVDPIKELSYRKYGRPREEIEAEIASKFKKWEDVTNKE